MQKSLIKYAWLSVAAAIATIILKTAAYYFTDSVGLLSDAVESLVNLVGGLMAVTMLTISNRPADEDHPFGHSKAEYFSSGVEGSLIVIAAIIIIYTAIGRLIHPKELEQIGVGVVISVIASLINLAVALLLLNAGKKNNSITLIANAKHLLTDVWTTAGLIVALILIYYTKIIQIDPIVALIVAINILWAGGKIVKESVNGLMDQSLPLDEVEIIKNILKKYLDQDIHFHALLTRKSGAKRFVSFHAVVPGEWTINEGHILVHKIEDEIKTALNNIDVISHLEPIESPTSWDDVNFATAIQKSSGQFHCEERSFHN